MKFKVIDKRTGKEVQGKIFALLSDGELVELTPYYDEVWSFTEEERSNYEIILHFRGGVEEDSK